MVKCGHKGIRPSRASDTGVLRMSTMQIAPFLQAVVVNKGSDLHMAAGLDLYFLGGPGLGTAIDMPSVRLDRSTWCPPRLIPDNSRRSIRVSTVTRQSAGMPRSPRPRLETVDLQLVISATGNVARVARIGHVAVLYRRNPDQPMIVLPKA